MTSRAKNGGVINQAWKERTAIIAVFTSPSFVRKSETAEWNLLITKASGWLINDTVNGILHLSGIAVLLHKQSIQPGFQHLY